MAEGREGTLQVEHDEGETKYSKGVVTKALASTTTAASALIEAIIKHKTGITGNWASDVWKHHDATQQALKDLATRMVTEGTLSLADVLSEGGPAETVLFELDGDIGDMASHELVRSGSTDTPPIEHGDFLRYPAKHKGHSIPHMLVEVPKITPLAGEPAPVRMIAAR